MIVNIYNFRCYRQRALLHHFLSKSQFSLLHMKDLYCPPLFQIQYTKFIRDSIQTTVSAVEWSAVCYSWTESHVIFSSKQIWEGSIQFLYSCFWKLSRRPCFASNNTLKKIKQHSIHCVFCGVTTINTLLASLKLRNLITANSLLRIWVEKNTWSDSPEVSGQGWAERLKWQVLVHKGLLFLAGTIKAEMNSKMNNQSKSETAIITADFHLIRHWTLIGAF